MILEGRPAEDLRWLDNVAMTTSADDFNAVPHWLAMLNMFSFLAGIVLLICGLIVRFS